tara:strand:- start:168 stop:335 length:168 start_codon:yes stop_codon:yes gene_type:complete
MDHPDKINPLTDRDRRLLADLSETFDLGTQSIIGQHEDEIIDEISNLMEDCESIN